VTFGPDPEGGGDESGCSVVDEEEESSTSSEGGEDGGGGEVSRISERPSDPSFCRDRSFWIRDWEKGVLWGLGDVEYSSTVVLTAVAISSLDV
jgi:hypothetical protein